MTAATLVAAAPAPSDADLLTTTASLLSALPGEYVGPRLSSLLEMVCAVHCPDGASHAVELEYRLAAYLHDRHVLSTQQLSPDGVDDWASHAKIVCLRAVLVACARRVRSGGAR